MYKYIYMRFKCNIIKTNKLLLVYKKHTHIVIVRVYQLWNI